MEDRIMKLYKELDFFYLIIHLLKMTALMSKTDVFRYGKFKRKHGEGFVLYVSVNKGLEKTLQNIPRYGQYS